MSNMISEVLKLKYNSVTLAPAMLTYFENCEVEKDNVLMVYLLLPVILNNDWINGSPIVKKASRFDSWVRENRIHIEGLPERLSTFQSLTETTLQYCIDNELVRVDESNNVVIIKNPYKKNKGVLIDSARRLSKLMGKTTAAKAYATLGIKKLEFV